MDCQVNKGICKRIGYGMCCAFAYIVLTLSAPMLLIGSWLMVTG